MTRRSFLEGVAATGAAALTQPACAASRPAPAGAAVARRAPAPLVIASANGWRGAARPDDPAPRQSAVETALALLGDAEVAAGKYGLLEAVVAGVGVVEDDPEDHSVGLGGLPNEEGVVQLDAAVMFGPTHQAGAVAALENIQNPARAAMYVLRYTDHALIVGPGAYRFARAFGMPHAELLTEEARKMWLYWKQRANERDDWLTPPDEQVEESVRRAYSGGTIHLSALDAQGDLAAATTTSGLSYKISGRVGDSPLVGAGLFCDNDVGAAGATGRGEEVIVNCGAYAVVAAMRRGLEPKDACLETLKEVAEKARRRGLFQDGKPSFGLSFYALRKDGAYGSAAMFEGGTFAVADAATGAGRHEPCAWLYDR
ncbi:MAG: isoaspartyl peptidase/L-asparaginase [Planctomycetes bacterium]|nr:isoaspartyl peptidase/L-asparaginase [Planctomycetota bacterium]